jgi:hypothetical protein
MMLKTRKNEQMVKTDLLGFLTFYMRDRSKAVVQISDEGAAIVCYSRELDMKVTVIIFLLLLPVAASAELKGDPFHDDPRKATNGKDAKILYPPAGLDELRQEIRRVVEVLSHGDDGRPLDPPDPRFAELIDQLWTLLGKWTAAYLQTHPKASARNLTVEMARLSIIKLPINFDDQPYALDAKAIRLVGGARAAYVISANWAWAGTFFIVARKESGSFQVVWDIKRVAKENYPLRNELGYWADLPPGFHNGPLGGHVSILPPGEAGRPRFYMDAITHPQTGSERPAQISIWEWNGREPNCLFIKSYYIDYHSWSVSFSKGLLNIRTKEELETFYICGNCGEPAGIWRLRIGRNKIEDLGHRYLKPEFQLIDRLFYAIQQGKEVSDFASPQAARTLRSALPQCKTDEKYCLGNIFGMKFTRRKGYELFEFSTDNFPRSVFKIVRHNRRLFVSSINVLDKL